MFQPLPTNMESRLKQCRDCKSCLFLVTTEKSLRNWQIFRGDFKHYSILQKMLTCLGLFHEKASSSCVVLISTVHVVINEVFSKHFSKEWAVVIDRSARVRYHRSVISNQWGPLGGVISGHRGPFPVIEVNSGHWGSFPVIGCDFPLLCGRFWP